MRRYLIATIVGLTFAGVCVVMGVVYQLRSKKKRNEADFVVLPSHDDREGDALFESDFSFEFKDDEKDFEEEETEFI